MKVLLLRAVVLISLLVPALSFSGAANAYSVVPGCASGGALAGSGAEVCKDVNSGDTKTDPVYKVIKTAIEIISFVTGVAAVILIVISGIRFITSGGDPNKVSGAKNTLLYAVIGIFVVLIAQGIIAFILDKIS